MLATLALTLLLAGPADRQEAERLFELGRAALKADDLATACPAFERSFTLEPALGTLLNLATCLETSGRLASAWVRFNEGLAWAERTREADREQVARAHADALRPRLSWLAVRANVEAEATLDGQPLRVGPWATSVPVDRGEHVLVVEVSGYQRVRRAVTTQEPGTTRVELVLTPSAAPAAPPPPPTPTPAAAPVVTAKAGTAGPSGGGVALVVTGGVTALAGVVGLVWSFTTYDRLQRYRVTGSQTDFVSLSDFQTLQWLYPASWVVAGVGAAGLVIGAVLLAVSPRTSVAFSPFVAPGGGGLTFGASW